MTNPEKTTKPKLRKEKSAKLPSCQKCQKEKNPRELIEGLCADCRQPSCENCGANHLTADCRQKKLEATDDIDEIPNKDQTISQLERQIQAKEQRILALEADKTDLIQQLSQQQTQYQNHLSQEKVQLTQEIQLIKEVIQ